MFDATGHPLEAALRSAARSPWAPLDLIASDALVLEAPRVMPDAPDREERLQEVAELLQARLDRDLHPDEVPCPF